jgi:hypothetical protein
VYFNIRVRKEGYDREALALEMGPSDQPYIEMGESQGANVKKEKQLIHEFV